MNIYRPILLGLSRTLGCAVIASNIFVVPASSFDHTPEDGVMQWFQTVQAGDVDGMRAAMCRKARRLNGLTSALFGDRMAGTLRSAGVAADFSALRFDLVRMSSSGLTARVRVSGAVRLLDGRIIDFASLNAQRGQTNIALAVFEDGRWRHCDYIPL